MKLITCENLTLGYEGKAILSGLNFTVNSGDYLCIVGENGSGKSTLMKTLLHLQSPMAGTITMGDGLKINEIGYLPQQTALQRDFPASVEEIVMSGFLGRMGLRPFYTKAEKKEARELMEKTRITDLAARCYRELSGGQRKRLALVSVLITPCDVLILDEPTNHLDSEMADWLENKLQAFRGALVMVTHDRYFLDSVTNKIIELDKGKIYSYDEKYSGFLQRKAEREESVRASERKRQSILRKEIEWISRGARARSTKQKAHIQRYEALKNQKAPEVDEKLQLSSISSRMGKTTIEIENVSKAYGENTLIRDFSYIFLKHDRIGFVGKNGCGKTTLVKMIAGRIEPDAGSIKVGQTIRIGYYTQEIEKEESAGIAYMDADEKVIDYIKNTAEFVRTSDGLVSASAMLERFLFPPSQQYSAIGKLSGGEKRRLNLLRVLMEAPNVLILDEPTNDLDIETMTILEDYLDDFDGIVITVSHDRYFLDRIVTRIFAFEENGAIRQYEGGYTDYVKKRSASTENSFDGKTKSHTGNKEARMVYKNREKKLKFSYQEQREYETIEEDISVLETTIETLDQEMAENGTDYVKLRELSEKKDEAEEQLMEKMERWEYLEELAEKIANQ